MTASKRNIYALGSAGGLLPADCTLALSSATRVHAQAAAKLSLKRSFATAAKLFCIPLYHVVLKPRRANILVAGQSVADIRKCRIIVTEMTKNARNVHS